MRFATTGALAATLWLPSMVQANLCLMMYQMADNNLEKYLRQDFQELTESTLINDPTMTTWIYFDGLDDGLPDPIEGLYDASGAELTEKYTGSRYITFDHDLKKMIVETTIPDEQNSDLKAVLLAYLTHGLTDCVAKGSDSYMIVFSSHGGGTIGFGGDEHAPPEARHRSLLQANQDIAGAIAEALAAVPGSPAKVDVVGFDACLMQGFDVADDYTGVAKSVLASETVEPGHGWAYNTLLPVEAGGAINLAEQVVDSFISEKQGGNKHETPKLLSLVDTEKYGEFAPAMDALFGEIATVMNVGEDQNLHMFLSRSRSFALSFESVIDEAKTKFPSAVDIGSWMTNFDEKCNPPAGSVLRTKLDAAKDAYEAMYLKRGVGEGTVPGTGMHMTWPLKSEFQADEQLWNMVLFKAKRYASFNVPNFQDVMRLLFETSTPEEAIEGASVCSNEGTPAQEPANNATLFIEPESTVESSNVRLAADLAASVDQVVVEYGVDLTTPLKPFLADQGFTPKDDEYLFLFGGDVWGTSSGSSHEANWNRNFYFLEIDGGGSYEALYVFDQEGGSQKNVPVMYFPADKQQAADDLQLLDFLFFDMQKWKEMGARYGFLTYSVDETGEPVDNLILFTFDNSGNSKAQVTRDQGGTIVPIVWVDAHIQDRDINILPGGFNQTKVPWREELNYEIIARKDTVIFDIIEDADAVVVSMFAYNFDKPSTKGGLEKQFFDITRPDKGQDGPVVIEGVDMTVTESESGAVPVRGFVGMLATTLFTLVYAFF